MIGFVLIRKWDTLITEIVLQSVTMPKKKHEDFEPRKACDTYGLAFGSGLTLKTMSCLLS